MILALGLSVILLRHITEAENITCNTLCVQGPIETAETCNTTTGACLYGCNVGFAGPNCTYKCPDSCLHPTDNETRTCDHISWECLQGCKEGFAGPNCSILCPENCLSDERGVEICNETTEQCLFGCKSGFYGLNCTGRCSDVDANCEQCSARDGDIVIECNKCIQNFFLSDGKCLSCNFWCVYKQGEPVCRQNDGYCNHGCRQGRYGITCGRRCSNTCKDECHRKTGMCFDCKYPSYCGSTCELQCQDGCSLQQCNQSCQCVNGCTATHWGETCQTVCNFNCIKPSGTHIRVCNSLNGTCYLGCDGERFWKSQCSEPCSSNCVNGTCEHYTGHCKDGCTSNRVYGGRCDMPCNKNCYAATCEREDGYCDKGCKEGSYGNNCGKNCSATCLNQKCNRVDGSCIDGCITGFEGQNCERGCKEGSYNCEHNCSETCLNQKCNRDDGSCTDGCIVGYEGQNCKTETKTVDKSLLGLAISGWTLCVILLAFVTITTVRRRLRKSKRNKTNAEEDPQAQIRNQQVYTTLQHGQDEVADKAKYEVLRFGKENTTREQVYYGNSGL